MAKNYKLGIFYICPASSKQSIAAKRYGTVKQAVRKQLQGKDVGANPARANLFFKGYYYVH